MKGEILIGFLAEKVNGMLNCKIIRDLWSEGKESNTWLQSNINYCIISSGLNYFKIGGSYAPTTTH
jgi:hypothetical protein